MIRRILSLMIVAVIIAALLSGCASEPVTTGKIGVVRDEEFGNVYIALTIDEFNALGFSFGDSVDIAFDNGKSFTDIPYYSGYYVPVGEMLACGYPGYPHVVIARNYGSPTWEEFGMTEDSGVTVTLNEKGKYSAVQELYALEYSDERNDFDSDEMFANFRTFAGGNMPKDTFYRSASPCDDQHRRASTANRLAEEKGIRSVLNLSDSEAKYKGYTEKEDFSSEYYDSLCQSGDVLFLAMNANYRSDDFAKKIADALLEISSHEKPCLIHCVEGKDRTGFVCALMSALAGASAQEIIDDYMITYYNYYRVTKEKEPDRYEAILGNVYDFIYCMCGAEKGTPADTLDLKSGARSYLAKGGLTDEQIAAVESYVTTP